VFAGRVLDSGGQGAGTRKGAGGLEKPRLVRGGPGPARSIKEDADAGGIFAYILTNSKYQTLTDVPLKALRA
jgi:hypothetical protein